MHKRSSFTFHSSRPALSRAAACACAPRRIVQFLRSGPVSRNQYGWVWVDNVHVSIAFHWDMVPMRLDAPLLACTCQSQFPCALRFAKQRAYLTYPPTRSHQRLYPATAPHESRFRRDHGRRGQAQGQGGERRRGEGDAEELHQRHAEELYQRL